MKSKIFTMLILAILTEVVWADNNHEKFRFVTGETFKNINLDYEVTSTHFKTDYIATLCSRTAWNGNSYHTQWYTCIQPRTIAYQVHDYNVFANVNFNFGVVPNNSMISAQFDLKLKNANLEVEVSKVKNLVVVGTATKKISTQNNNDKIVEADYQIKFYEATPIFSPIVNGINKLSVNEKILSFVMGKNLKPEFSTLNIEVKKYNFLKDKSLYNEVLRLDQYEVEAVDRNLNLIKIDLAKLPIEFKKKDKYVFVITSKVIIPGEILNKDELPKFEISEKIKSRME